MSPTDVPDGSIVITPREFYDGVKKDINGLHADLDQIKEAVVGLPRRVDALEQTVAALRAKVYWLSGFAAAIGALVGLIGHTVLYH